MLNRKTLVILTALLSSLNTHAQSPVQVYTYDSFTADWGPAPKLKSLFEQQTQCKINFVSFNNSITMFNRIRLEGEKTKADIALGLDNSMLEDAKKSSLFAESTVNLANLQLPIEWQDHIFIPYDFGQYAFIYDKTKLNNPPKSLKELIERQDLRIIYQDPRTSSVGRGLLSWMNLIYPQNEITQAWQKLAQHTVTIGKGWNETFGAFLKGESDLVLSYNSSPLYYQLNEQNDQYVATEFPEGGVLQIEMAAKIKGKTNPCSEDFLQFLLTPPAQKIIAEQNVMLPVINTEIEPHFDQLRRKQLKQNILNPTPISRETIKQWINLWQSATVL